MYSARVLRGLNIALASALLTGLAFHLASPRSLWEGRFPTQPALSVCAWGGALGLWLWNVWDARRLPLPPESIESELA